MEKVPTKAKVVLVYDDGSEEEVFELDWNSEGIASKSKKPLQLNSGGFNTIKSTNEGTFKLSLMGFVR